MVELTIAICVLLLLAYLFDFTFARTRIPTVILLLALGWGVRQVVNYFAVPMPDIAPLLPLLGTIGLILIVLEGSLELELERSKAGRITKSFFMSLLPMLVFVFGGAWLMSHFFQVSFLKAMINLVPLGIISSAISIPSSRYLCPENKEFVTYEGSFSDTLGVLFFNIIIVQKLTEGNIVSHLFWMMIIVVIASLLSTLLLSYLLRKIKHRVKFVPIILITLLLYSVAEYFHMPGLIFVMLFGIFIENAEKLTHIKFIRKIHPERIEGEVTKFKDLTSEASFLVRSAFFLLFGYLLETSQLLDTKSLVWALAIVAGIYLVRYIFIKIFRINANPLLFIAPRGLITIVLFLSIPAVDAIPYISQSLVIQVILLTSIVMMIAIMTSGKKKKKSETTLKHVTSSEDRPPII